MSSDALNQLKATMVTKDEFNELKADVHELKATTVTKDEFNELKADVHELKADVHELKVTIGGMENSIVTRMATLLVLNGVHPQPALGAGLADDAAPSNTATPFVAGSDTTISANTVTGSGGTSQ